MPSRWVKRRRSEHYYRRAKREGYRSRAVYKLIQIDEEFGILDNARAVLDLGSSPGSWCQYVRERVPDAKIYAVDKVRMRRIEGVRFFRGDFLDEDFRNFLIEKIVEESGGVDVILSDMAPNISGKSSYDHARSVELAEKILEFAPYVLRMRGNAVVKVFDGDMLKSLRNRYEGYFLFVRLRKPRASLKSSAEIYIVAKDFRFSNIPGRRSSSTITTG